MNHMIVLFLTFLRHLKTSIFFIMFIVVAPIYIPSTTHSVSLFPTFLPTLEITCLFDDSLPTGVRYGFG